MIDFVGIGAEKSATRWIAKCLLEHPEVSLGSEPGGSEIFFFNEFDPHLLQQKNPKYAWGIDWYLSHFDLSQKAVKKGEISPTYLYSKKTAKRIKKHFPDIKIIVSLRDPVERSFSQYLHDQKIGIMRPMSFKKALKKNKTYIEKSLYFKHLKNYYEIFGPDKIRTVLVDDIEKDAQKTISKIYKFLDLKNTAFEPMSLYQKQNVYRKARLQSLNYLLIHAEYVLKRFGLAGFVRLLENLGVRKIFYNFSAQVNTKSVFEKPKLDKKAAKKLYLKFKKDIEELEKLIKRDLSAWKKYENY